jgi:DNA invertase Pin-like site-specific DNA recombinase
VADDDLGRSGATAEGREGFQRLVDDVGMGKAGIVLGLEVSRLARNNADWHRLLEICALTETLILDEDGLYDPCAFNDRLLLGLKGQMSEAELHLLRARLRGGVLSKARRGELAAPLPVGLVYDPAGKVVFDPDAGVQQTIRHLFATFARTGSARATVKAFAGQGVTPSGFDLSSSTSPGWGDFSTTTLSADRTMSVHTYRLNDNGTISNLSAGRQELRAGHDPVEILVTSSDTAVGTITTSPVTFTAAGGLSRNTAFNPLTAGSTDITIGHPEGFTAPTNGRTTITATVTATE